MNSSSESPRTSGVSTAATSSDAISQRVAQIAAASKDRSDFLRHLASELLAQFQSGLVAIDTSHWTNPMMLVADDDLSQQIERSAITELLASATSSAIACNINSTDDDVDRRGLRIELTHAPHRAALLMIYPAEQAPTPMEQVTDLQTLSRYAESTRSVVETLPVPETELRRQSPTDLTTATHSVQDTRSLASFHRDLDVTGTSYRIANETRRMLDCDRVTVLVPHARQFRVTAVSGVSVVDRRSNAVKSIERLTQSAVIMARPMVLPSEDPLPPQIQEPLDYYLDESGVAKAIILPLHQSSSDEVDEDVVSADPFDQHGELVGVIVLEYFTSVAPPGVRPPMSIIATEAMLALTNSIEHRKVFGLPIWKAIGSLTSRSRFPITSAVAVALVGLLTASILIPVEHHVVTTGKLEPAMRREVFAPLDGVVKTLLVTDGQVVKAGDPILELENADLESQSESLAGDIQTKTGRLGALASMRLTETSDVSASSRLAMEQRQLESELANLKTQQAILEQQQSQLIVTAPIDGTIVAWQLQRRLSDRPVSRGNLLVSVVSTAGPWTLDLNLPDRDAGPVLEAAKDNPNLPIEFAVATLPEQSFRANLQTIATAARLDTTGNRIIDAEAVVHFDDLTNPTSDASSGAPFDATMMRAGADVTAKIACGERSLLRSWFSDVFDFVHRNILFHF
ncbi:biotin/lipoyl-binding protein [Rubripirellula amarantea]|uniref:HlyD family secretion protein n=1 Tax=Rubripirellula amarantea TaxID=2527999 RepID=A0A5C5WL58_9BACT|nr:biotin/lipoyl-binding protein [Rubripirellula amarantea]MDA8745995.1 biotin/lipoyl-binding protein [Rubripirellula amarantea]TWT50502.1 HlyD family secretion protein [Rubripirellula amarantea]